jgi:hypothetical protein
MNVVGSHPHWEKQVGRVGWFIPPYASTGWLDTVVKIIEQTGEKFDQADLQNILAMLYTSSNLASMVLNRYPKIPVVNEYKVIIAESAEAHFLRLDHIAAAGLVPVVEGIGRKLAKSNGVDNGSVSKTFCALAEHCKNHVITRQIGAVSEIVTMLDSFASFTKEFLFTSSPKYTLEDGTNRHGMTHGFCDTEYGSPLNFYKIISAVNFLTFISSLYYGGSGFVPDDTDESKRLALYYEQLSQIAKIKPVGSCVIAGSAVAKPESKNSSENLR